MSIAIHLLTSEKFLEFIVRRSYCNANGVQAWQQGFLHFGYRAPRCFAKSGAIFKNAKTKLYRASRSSEICSHMPIESDKREYFIILPAPGGLQRLTHRRVVMLGRPRRVSLQRIYHELSTARNLSQTVNKTNGCHYRPVMRFMLPPSFRAVCNPDRANQCTHGSNRTDPHPIVGWRQGSPWKPVVAGEPNHSAGDQQTKPHDRRIKEFK